MFELVLARKNEFVVCFCMSKNFTDPGIVCTFGS